MYDEFYMTPTERKETITRRLEQAFFPDTLTVIDESQQHIGHPGAAAGGGHYAVTIVSTIFMNLPLIKRHQLVYHELKDLIPHEIHALKINARTPQESSEK